MITIKVTCLSANSDLDQPACMHVNGKICVARHPFPLCSYHHGSLEVFLRHSSSTEEVPVGKVLRGHVADGQLGQHHLGPRLVDFLQLVVQDVPLCIHNGLVVLEAEKLRGDESRLDKLISHKIITMNTN